MGRSWETGRVARGSVLLAAILATALLFLAWAAPGGAAAATWKPVTGTTGVSNEVDEVRTPDGVLHIVWARDTPGAAGYHDVVTATISPNGAVSAPLTIAAHWSSAGNPAIVIQPGNALSVFFGGIQCTDPSCPTGLFTASSNDLGASWTKAQALFDRDFVYGSDLDAATVGGATVLQAWSATTGVTVHQSLLSGSPDYDFQGPGQGGLGAGCCGYDPQLATDAGDDVQLAWASNADRFLGVWTQAVDPASAAPSGPPSRMPGSVASYGGGPAFGLMAGRTPLTAVPGERGFLLAYPVGYPTSTKVLLWRIGSGATTTIVDEAQDHNAVSVAGDGQGRVWVFYSRHNSAGRPQVMARRVGAGGLETPVDLGAPVGADGTYSLDGTVTAGGDPEVLGRFSVNGSTAAYYARGPQTAPPPPPVLGRAVNLVPVSGTVLVKLPKRAAAAGFTANLTKGAGPGFVPLTQARQLPTGTQVDARRGALRLISAGATRGGTQSGVFNGSIFSIQQTRTGLSKGLTTLTLVENAFKGAPSFAGCARVSAGGPRAGQAALSQKVLQALLATAHGRFRTRGRFSAGTVRGTSWGTRDRCDGTLTIVRRGTVLVDDFGRRKVVPVHAGHRYLARAFGPGTYG